jgi:3-hydroxyisobutyrate dehydrogenase-like beta-hydroxyacid dehydrogenase
MHVGVIGVGLLGTAVAQRLLAAGFEVTGYDVAPERLQALRAAGLRPAASAAEVALKAEAIFTILPSLESVEATIAGPGGLLATAPRHSTLLQMSTISPTLTRRLGEAADAAGLAFLDTPISGTSVMVARGECTIFVGGDRTRAEACRPIFDALARQTVYVGPVGSASVAKLAANLVGGINAIALAEALVLGAKAGVEPAALLDALRQTPVASRTMDTRGPLMVSHRFDPQIRLDLFLKDFRLMLDEARRLGVALPLTGAAELLCTATSSAGRGGEDLAAVITTLERLAGIGS